MGKSMVRPGGGGGILRSSFYGDRKWSEVKWRREHTWRMDIYDVCPVPVRRRPYLFVWIGINCFFPSAHRVWNFFEFLNVYTISVRSADDHLCFAFHFGRICIHECRTKTIKLCATETCIAFNLFQHVLSSKRKTRRASEREINQTNWWQLCAVDRNERELRIGWCLTTRFGRHLQWMTASRCDEPKPQNMGPIA